MTAHWPILIPLLPLTAALLSPLCSRLHKDSGKWLVITAIAGSFVSALAALDQVLDAGEPVHYWMGNWQPPLGIEFVIDPLNGALAVLVTFIALLNAVYAAPFTRGKQWLEIGGYYTLYGLLTVGLSGMILTGDLFNLYVFLEITSLSGYGLIALGGNRSCLAAFRYLLIGTIGASLYLLGIGFLYATTGTLNMADMGVLIANHTNSPILMLSAACLIIGFGIKMALFPLHGWQPDAYTYAHPGAAALIAGIMGKVPAYAMLRFLFYIFGVDNPVIASALNMVGILGALGILLGSVMAIAQSDFRRMLAYSSVAQIGYIAVGLAIGNFYGLIGAVMHIINHAFMKSSLFMVIGAVQYRYGETSIYRLGQLNKKLPYTMFTLVVAALSMIGLPPTAGFISKWYLMLGALQGQQYVYIGVIVISSLLNAIYFFRVLEEVFISPSANLTEQHPLAGKRELPWPMLLPIVALGVGILWLGFYSTDIVAILKLGLPEVFLR